LMTTIIEGLPAGLNVVAADINADLARRQGGYGRGARQKIETDTVEITAGVRFGKTLGSPVTLSVRNRDWMNWSGRMQIEPLDEHAQPIPAVTIPRPGHADFVGMRKYNHDDLRNVLERSSARNTATLVAVGGVARTLLKAFGIDVVSHIVQIGSVKADYAGDLTADAVRERAAESPVSCISDAASTEMVALIDSAKRRGDTLGGVFEVVVFGLPIGLGSYVHWDERIDGRLGQAILSINAVKGVEIGLGFGVAALPGSQVHDEFAIDDTGHVLRPSNRAGGTEGGITNGQPLVVRGAMKPIATLMRQLGSVNVQTGQAAPAFAERSDVCAVPAAGVIAEAMVAIVLMEAFLEKFGGDSMDEIRRNYDAYMAAPFGAVMA
jgi:chorismate synthase